MLAEKKNPVPQISYQNATPESSLTLGTGTPTYS